MPITVSYMIMKGKDDQDKLTKMKALIRSVLIPAPTGLTLHEFEHDYLEFIGEKIPYPEYGFSTLKALLESLHDVVQFFRDQYGNVKLKQVSDESTKHIEKLVAKQKKNPKKTRGYNPRGRGGGFAPRRGGRGHFYSQPRGRQPVFGISSNKDRGPCSSNSQFSESFQNRSPCGFRNLRASYPRVPRHSGPFVWHRNQPPHSQNVKLQPPDIAENVRPREDPPAFAKSGSRSSDSCSAMPS